MGEAHIQNMVFEWCRYQPYKSNYIREKKNNESHSKKERPHFV